MQGHNYHRVIGKGYILNLPGIESILCIQNSNVFESDSLEVDLFVIEINFHTLKKYVLVDEKLQDSIYKFFLVFIFMSVMWEEVYFLVGCFF